MVIPLRSPPPDHAAASGDHDLIILDVTPPGNDSFALLCALRTFKQTLVLVLTTRYPAANNAKGSALRADDYLVKPFEFAELLARVRALATRGNRASEPELLRVGDLEVYSFKQSWPRKTEQSDEGGHCS